MTEKIKQLERLLLSEDLEELSLMTNQFNIFRALKLQNAEIRHSNFLGWLMAPYENHGLGDYFLKEFLKTALKKYSLKNETEVCLGELAFFNLSDSEIRREYKNIDLLIISPKNKFICIIENKVWTDEHDCQLERYADIVSVEFNEYKKLYIYLSPTNEDNCELMQRERIDKTAVAYIPMNYEQVYYAIDKTLKFKAKYMNDDVKTFIEHYKNMIERNIMGNTDGKVVELCRKIYRENKEAIDLIIENNDVKPELFEILKEVILENPNFDNVTLEDNSIICLPKNIENIDKLRFAKWVPDDFIVHLHFMNFINGHKEMCFELLLGPLALDKDKSKRDELKNILSESLNIKFNGNDEWTYTQPISLITLNEYYKYDNCEDVKAHIKQKLEECKALYIDKLRDILNGFC